MLPCRVLRRLGGRALTTLSVLVLTALTPALAQAPKMKIGYTGSASFASVFIAKDLGLFDKHGVDVELVFMTKGSIIPASLVGGSLQAGIVTSPGILRQAEGKMDLVALSPTGLNSHAELTLALVARTDFKVTNAKDFEGKRIGIAGLAGILDVLARKWMADRGADLSKITFLEVGFPQLSDMLKSGQIDAATAAEPFIGRILANKTGYVAAEFMKDMPEGMLQGAFMSTRKWADANKPAVLAYRAAVAEVVARYNADREIINEPLSRHLKLPLDLVKTLPKPTLGTEITLAQLEFWNDVCLERAITRAKVDVKDIVFK